MYIFYFKQKKQASIEELAEECRKLLDYIQSETVPVPENDNLNTSDGSGSGSTGSFNFDDLLENLNSISKNETRLILITIITIIIILIIKKKKTYILNYTKFLP